MIIVIFLSLIWQARTDQTYSVLDKCLLTQFRNWAIGGTVYGCDQTSVPGPPPALPIPPIAIPKTPLHTPISPAPPDSNAPVPVPIPIPSPADQPKYPYEVEY